MLWRLSPTLKVYESCKQMDLPEGVLISHDFEQPVKYIRSAVFNSKCYKNSIPMMNTNMNLVINKFSENLPIVRDSWQQYTSHVSSGHFMFSVAPIVYSMAVSAVTTWFLTIFVFTNYTTKPSLLLRSSTLLASVYMLTTVIRSITVLHHQQRQGYLHAPALLDTLNNLVYLQVIDLIVTVLLQVNQVQVLMRLFSRQRDKRLVFVAGLSATIASQALWGLSKFHNFGDDEAGIIIPAFVYLIRLSMSITYAAIFNAFIVTKIKTLWFHRNIWAITALSIVFIYAPVGFFVADVTNVWMYELSEVFSVVTYVVCVVIPWEWCNKFNIVRRKEEKEGVLGRKFYEEEIYELDRFELFSEEDSDSDNTDDYEKQFTSSSNTGSSSSGGVASPSGPANEMSALESQEQTDSGKTGFAGFSHRVADKYGVIRDGFVKFTDLVIATGMAIPRSVSTGSSYDYNLTAPQFDERLENPVVATMDDDNNREELQATSRTDREVFVYSTRDVRIED